MSFLESLSPLLRRKASFLVLWILAVGAIMGGISMIPKIQESTIYFTIRSVGSDTKEIMVPGVEDGEKVAEVVSGWAKDPGFRAEILKKAGVEIAYFKRKISSQKQNRLNVFWNLSFWGDEIPQAEKVTKATVDTIKENFAALTAKTSFQFEMTEPRVFSEPWTIPMSWLLLGAIIIGGIFSGVILYLWESLRGKVSYKEQIRARFPKSPFLCVSEKIGRHDKKLLEQFLMTFESPRLISTFKKAERHFSISAIDSINTRSETPVLLVRLGQTKLQELENIIAIFGDNVGIIVFEK